jgi:transcriptional regulator with XRE-family HTH domain
MATRIEIGKAVRAGRAERGFTQLALSELTGINKSTISEIENGRFSGSFDIFERVLNALDLTFDVVHKQRRLPDWDELDTLFAESDK